MVSVQGEGDLWTLLRVPRQGPSTPGTSARRGPDLGQRPWKPDPDGAIQALSALIRHDGFTGQPRRVELGEPSEEETLKETLIQSAELELEKELEEKRGFGDQTEEPPILLTPQKERRPEGEEKASNNSILYSWLSSPSSQLRKLIRGPFWDQKGREVKGDMLPPNAAGKLLKPSLGFKRNRPPKKTSKSKRKKVMDIVNKFDKREKLLREFESNFLSVTSKAPKESRANFVMLLLQDLAGDTTPFPLTSRSIKMLGAVLWKAGYKSAEAYLAEAKQMHIEAGYIWTQILEFNYKKCKVGVARNRGPRRKAPEVPETVRKAKRKAMLPPKVPVLFPRELFTFAMVWMLRRIELEQIEVEDLVINEEDREVELHWKKAKCDQTAGGTMRVLKCLCVGGECEEECPFWVSKDLVRKVLTKVPGASNLCWQKRNLGKKATKCQIVKSWAMAFGMGVTGHSGRRTGALNYIRLGWTIPQVTYLGRWRSGVIYDYAQEALQERPVNLKEDEKEKGDKSIEMGRALVKMQRAHRKELMTKLQLEIDEYKRDAGKTLKALEKEVEDLAKNFGSATRNPPNVMSIHSKVVHRNVTPVTSTPPLLWRTVCWWYFKEGGFCFVADTTQVTCTKCIGAEDARSQRGVMGIL